MNKKNNSVICPKCNSLSIWIKYSPKKTPIVYYLCSICYHKWNSSFENKGSTKTENLEDQYNKTLLEG